MSTQNHTHKLTINVARDSNLHYTAASFQDALKLYDEVCSRLTIKAWGYKIVELKNVEVN